MVQEVTTQRLLQKAMMATAAFDGRIPASAPRAALPLDIEARFALRPPLYHNAIERAEGFSIIRCALHTMRDYFYALLFRRIRLLMMMKIRHDM